MSLSADKYFISETLKLAKKAVGWTNPNPMVGAIIVKKGKIIARGYHRKVGLPHAEIEAFSKAKGSVKGATLYVNLEPCSHQGRTPPCVDAIIQSGIKRVVCSTLDPNPKVHRCGIAKLKKASITVSVGLRAEESKALNEPFFAYHVQKRPFVALKFAASLDGKLATRTGDSKWITNPKARLFARGLRGEYQSILVGINTVIEDNPHLGTRNSKRKDPLRIVLDSKLKIPMGSKVLRDANVLIVTTSSASKSKRVSLTKLGIPLMIFKGKNISLRKLLPSLKKKEITSILVEGGGKILGSFVDAGFVDKVYAFYSPILIGGEKAVSIQGKGESKVQDVPHIKNVFIKHFGDNFLVIGSQG